MGNKLQCLPDDSACWSVILTDCYIIRRVFIQVVNLALWLLSSALGLFVVLCLGGIRETNALLRPSYTPLEAALYNR